jgi:negative regulator of flagellin synthesis FlgM
MTEKIGSFPRPSTETRPTGSQSASGTKHAAETSQGKTQASGGSDEISLTDTATRLKSIEARIAELPDVDRERVDEIRHQIESGEFRVDARLIAQRLAQLEQALS